MTIALGVNKQTRFKRQTAKGILAGSTLGQIIRRTSSVFDLQKASYTTEAEMTSTQQLLSTRQGERTINGKIAGILSPGTYSDMMASVVRRDWAAITAITGASFTIAVVTAGLVWSITRAAGSWLTDGVKVGYVGRITAGAFNAANLNKNLLVTSVTATVINVQLVTASLASLVAEGPITGATFTLPGKTTFAPGSGQTNNYYTVEEWYPDVPTSEVNQDCKVASMDVSMPGSGNCTVNVNMIGLDQSNNTTAYFTAPAVETSSTTLVGASGVLMYGGVAVGVLTNITMKIDGKEAVANGVVGSVVRPDVFRGKVMISGSITAYFDNAGLAAQFRAETKASLILVMTGSTSPTADFIAITLPQFSVTSATPMDAETGMTRTYNYVAEYYAAGGAGQPYEQSTIQLQDTLA